MNPDRDRARKGADFLAGRCACTTCERHAMREHPARYAAWCQERRRPVPAEVAALVEAEQQRQADAAAAWRPPYAVFGVDLGRRTDHSAVALLVPAAPGDPAGLRYRVPSVTRLPLSGGSGSHYLDQARRLAAAVGHVLERTTGPVQVMLDATGVGDAVAEMVGAHLPRDRRVRLVSVVLTGGRSETCTGNRWTVSKAALVGPVTAALEQGEIAFEPFEHADVVRRELLAYRVRPASIEGGPDRLEAERQSDHDDTVIAVSMAVYAARRVPAPVKVMVPTGRINRKDPVTDALYTRLTR